MNPYLERDRAAGLVRDPEKRLQHAQELLARHDRGGQPLRPGPLWLDRDPINFVPERALRWARAVVAGKDVCDWPSQMPGVA